MLSTKLTILILITTSVISQDFDLDEYLDEGLDKRDVDYSDQIKLASKRSIGKLSDNEKNIWKKVSGFESFFGQLIDKVKKLGENAPKQFETDQIRELLGAGHDAILFDCQDPSYINKKNKKTKLLAYQKHAIKDLMATNKCSEDNLWYSGGDKSTLITFNSLKKSLTSPPIPFQELAGYFLSLGMCDEFMKILKHPGYFLEDYKKPSICSKNSEVSLPRPSEAKKSRKRGRYKVKSKKKRVRYPTGGGCQGGG